MVADEDKQPKTLVDEYRDALARYERGEGPKPEAEMFLGPKPGIIARYGFAEQLWKAGLGPKPNKPSSSRSIQSIRTTKHPSQLTAIRHIALACLVALLTACARSSPSTQATLAPRPSPTPSPGRCWLYEKMYPATKAAYQRQRLSTREQREVENWAETVPRDRRSLVRWMRAPWISAPQNEHGPCIVFVYQAGSAYALNGNVMVNFEACTAFPYPP